MNTPTATPISTLADLVAAMADERRAYAAMSGVTVTDDEIAESVKASLLRMIAEVTK